MQESRQDPKDETIADATIAPPATTRNESLEYGAQSPFRTSPKYSLYLGLLATAFSIIGVVRMIAGRTNYNATHLPRWHFKVITWLATQLQPFWLLIFLAVPCICLAGVVAGVIAYRKENLDRRWAMVGIILSAGNLLWMLLIMTRL